MYGFCIFHISISYWVQLEFRFRLIFCLKYCLCRQFFISMHFVKAAAIAAHSRVSFTLSHVLLGWLLGSIYWLFIVESGIFYFFVLFWSIVLSLFGFRARHRQEIFRISIKFKSNDTIMGNNSFKFTNKILNTVAQLSHKSDNFWTHIFFNLNPTQLTFLYLLISFHQMRYQYGASKRMENFFFPKFSFIYFAIDFSINIFYYQIKQK